MNKVFRVIWNEATQSWVAVSELSKTYGKSASVGTSASLSGSVKFFTLTAISFAVMLGVNANAATSVSDGSPYCFHGVDNIVDDNDTALMASSCIIGHSNTLTGKNTFIIGSDNAVSGNNSHVHGNHNTVNGNNAVVFGNNISVIGKTGVAGSVAPNNVVVIGEGANPGLTNGSVTIGSGAKGETSYALATGTRHTSYGALFSPLIEANTANLAKPSYVVNSILENASGLVETQSTTVAIGQNSTARGGGVALGDNARALISPNANPLYTNYPAYADEAGGYDWNTGVVNRALGVAIGANALSYGGGLVIGSSASSENINGVAIGRQAVSKGSAAQALGVVASAVGDNALAVGHSATAVGKRSVAIGGADSAEDYDEAHATQVEGLSAVAIGSQARVGKNLGKIARDDGEKLADWNKRITDEVERVGALTANSIAIGTGATVESRTALTSGTSTGLDNTAIDSIAIGTGATVKGNQSIAIGTGNLVTGDYSGAIGDPTTISGSRSYSLGNNNTISGNKTFVVGNNVAATAENNVILGNDSAESSATTTAGAPNAVDSATVNDVKYSGFAGDEVVSGIVSVGSASGTRQIINVAPGAITATSTDAINGSQLYAVADKLGAGFNILDNAGAKKGTVTAAENVQFKNGSNTTVEVLDEVDSTTSIVYNVNTTKISDGTAGKFAVSGGLGSTSFVTAAGLTTALNQVGFTLSGSAEGGLFRDSANDKYIAHSDTLKLVADNNISITQVDDGFKIAAIIDNTTLGVTDAGKVATVASGEANKVVNAGDLAAAINKIGFTVTNNQAQGDTNKDALVNPGDTLNFNNGTGTTVTTSGSNVTVNVKQATAPTAGTNGKLTNPASNAADSFLTAANVVDAINNSGFTLKTSATADGEKDEASTGDELINPGDTVEMVAGKNLTVKQEATGKVTYATKENVSFTTINVGAPNEEGKIENPIYIGAKEGKNVITGLDTTLPDPVGNSGTKPANVTSNQAATLGDVLNAGWNLQVGGKAVDLVTPYDTVNFVGGNGVTVEADPASDGTTSNVKISIDTSGSVVDATKADGATDADKAGSVKPVNPTSLTTAQAVADAINASGWNAKSGGNKAEGDDATATLINPGEEVEFNAGTNLKVKRVGNVFTYETAKDVVFDSVQFGEDGPKIAKDGDTNNIKVGDKDGNSTSITNVTSGLETTNVPTAPTGKDGDKGTSPLVDLTVKEGGVPDSNVATVGDLRNMGWVVSAEGNDYTDTVKNANEVKFKGTGLATVTGETTKEGVREITVNVDAQNVVEAAQLPVVYTDGEGNKLAKVGNTFYNVADLDKNGEPVKDAKPVEPKDVIASMNNGDNSTTAPMTLTNIKSNLPSVNDADTTITNPDGTKVAAAPSNITKAPITAQQAAKLAADSANNAATLGDVLNAGWNLQGNGEAVDFVKPYDTVNFVNGEGTVAEVKTDDSLTSTVTYNVNVDNTTTEITYTNENGDKVYKVGDQYFTNPEGTGDAIDTKENPVTSQVSAKTTPLEVNKTGDDAGKVKTPENKDSLATAGDIANAINNSGWKLAAKGTPGEELINPSETVTFETGSDNLTVKRDGANIIYDLAKDIKVDSVKAGDTTINNNGLTIENGPSVTKDGIDAAGNKITNVAAGKDDTDAVNMSQLKQAQAAATTKVDGNQGVTVTPTNNADGSTTYTVTAKTDGKTITVDKDGNIAAVTSKLSNVAEGQPNAGKVNTPANENALATAGDIANAINNSGFTLKTSGNKLSGSDELINPGDVIDMVAGKNLTVKQEANGKVTYATKDDVVFDSVQLGDNGPKITNKDGNINVGGNGSPVKITGVADGDISPDSKDAINGSQLYAALSGAKTDVKSEDKSVTVTPNGNTFDLSVNTDDVTITKDPTTGAVKAVTSDLAVNNEGGVNTPAVPNALATAGDIANAINNSGWNLAAEGTDGTELINPSDKVTFKAGSKNLTVKRDGADITYDLAKDITVDSVKAGDTVMNNDGITINNGAAGEPVSLTKNGLNNGGNRITNVKAGEAPTDAVNVSQLKGIANQLDNKINRNNRNLRAGIAGANAAAGLPQVYIPGKSMVAASAGTFKGEGALAVGYSRASDNGKLILKLQGNANTRGDLGGSIGIGYQW